MSLCFLSFLGPMGWHRFDAFVPQENRKQTLSIFAKEIDVVFNITVGHKKKAASPAPQLLPGRDLLSFLHHYSKKMLSFTNSLFKMPLKKDNEVSGNNRFILQFLHKLLKYPWKMLLCLTQFPSCLGTLGITGI